MPTAGIVCGILLIIIGVAGYIHGLTSDKASITALIPAFFGIVLAALGAAAGGMENLRKHLMHVAVLIGLLGFLLPLGRVMSRLSEFTLNAATASQLAMSAICLVFVVLAVRSFIAARANR
jgi:hypothetical protein